MRQSVVSLIADLYIEKSCVKNLVNLPIELIVILDIETLSIVPFTICIQTVVYNFKGFNLYNTNCSNLLVEYEVVYKFPAFAHACLSLFSSNNL